MDCLARRSAAAWDIYISLCMMHTFICAGLIYEQQANLTEVASTFSDALHSLCAVQQCA